MCRLVLEFLRLETSQVVGLPQFLEEACGLVLDILGKAERIAALRYPNGPKLHGPIVDVLKGVAVHFAVMLWIKKALW